jgi:transcriptional regulator with XRE-family HTH domain
MAYKVQSYVRTYRKRTGLTQEDVAFLLGVNSGTKLSHYERLHRTPSLRTAFALEVIFGKPPKKLLPGAYAKVELETIKRAQMLSRKLDKKTPTSKLNHRLLFVRSLASGKASAPHHHEEKSKKT